MEENKANREKIESRSRVVIMITIAFIFLNVFVIGVGMLTPFGAERVSSLKELVFWFDISSMAVIASFFGADVWSKVSGLKGPNS